MIIKIPLQAVQLEAEGFHLFINVKLNNKSANLLLDTGASKTVFDVNRINNFKRKSKKKFETLDKLSTGLGTNSMESSFTTIKKFSISDELILDDFTAILLDMGHVNESYKMLNVQPIDGVLGSDLLMQYKAVINYKTKILKFTFSEQ